MGKKILFLSLLGIGVCLGSLSYVFGNGLISSGETRFIGAASNNIFLESQILSKNIIVFQSEADISQAKLTSLCTISSQFLTTTRGLYFFEVDFSGAKDCKNGNLVLELAGKKILPSLTKLQLKTQLSELSIYVDYPTETLKNLSRKLESEQKRYAIYKNYKGQDISKYFNFMQGQKKFYEAIEQKNIIDRIISLRAEKYAFPVPGKKILDTPSKLPNAGRPYRANYTDGIHHGWDITAPIGTDTVALDESIVIRVVRDFSTTDFSKIVYGEKLSSDQKLKNLDVLRGNQVWLKSMKGEVAFYSHLRSIPENILEGNIVKKGEKIGEVGISGVPDVDYTDAHLHIEIYQNPGIIEKAGTYDFGEYMSWDWQGRKLPPSEVKNLPSSVFE